MLRGLMVILNLRGFSNTLFLRISYTPNTFNITNNL